jgi:hypothetical protein
MAFRKLRLPVCSGPNIGSDAKDTNSEEVVRGVLKTVGEFIQGLRSRKKGGHVGIVGTSMSSTLESGNEDWKS